MSRFQQPNKSDLSKRQNLAPEIIEYNEKIKRPSATKVSSSGKFDLIFSELRIKEQEDVQSSAGSRILCKPSDDDLNSAPKPDIIRGVQVEGPNQVDGIRLEIYRSEASDPDKMQF